MEAAKKVSVKARLIRKPKRSEMKSKGKQKDSYISGGFVKDTLDLPIKKSVAKNIPPTAPTPSCPEILFVDDSTVQFIKSDQVPMDTDIIDTDSLLI